jgi:hypothetical protein
MELRHFLIHARQARDRLCALPTPPSTALPRPTRRVEIPRRNACRISSVTFGPRRASARIPPVVETNAAASATHEDELPPSNFRSVSRVRPWKSPRSFLVRPGQTLQTAVCYSWSALGCRLLCRRFCSPLQQKLHPLSFYTLKNMSPGRLAFDTTGQEV